MSDAERVERLLRMALTPVEPPEALSDRLERGRTAPGAPVGRRLPLERLAGLSERPRERVAHVVGDRRTHVERHAISLEERPRAARGGRRWP